jgi:hypothetical protein
MRVYIQNPTNEPMKAILKQFAPIAVIPPSPMTRAWIINEMETAISADHGPRRIATSADPDICPVVPPGIGKANIIITRLNTDPIAR